MTQVRLRQTGATNIPQTLIIEGASTDQIDKLIRYLEYAGCDYTIDNKIDFGAKEL